MKTAQWALVHMELRALLPWWAAIAVVIVMCSLVVRLDLATFISRDTFVFIGFFTYAIGAVLLGAVSTGHDYQHRTMVLLLMQPVSRARVLAAKVLVLTPLLLLLAAVVTAALDLPPAGVRLSSLPQAWFPLAAGLALAPGLALICSGPLAATVFATALLSGVVPVAAYFEVPVASLWPGIAALTLLGILVTWRAFARLEVTGGAGTEMGLVTRTTRRAAAVRAPRTGHPIWLLGVKELWLQQLAFVAAGLYLLIWISAWIADRVTDSYIPNELAYATTMLFGIVVSLLVGALASAEERRLGTADWQALLPISAGMQWVVKSGVALTLAMGLASVGPGLLTALAPNPVFSETFHPGLAASLCVIGLYTSSLSRSGVHALLAAPVIIAVSVFITGSVIMTTSPLVRWVAETFQPILGVDTAFVKSWDRHSYVFVIGGAGLLLLFAAANHVTVDRSRGRLARQAAWVLAYGVASMLVNSTVFTMGVLSRMR